MSVVPLTKRASVPVRRDTTIDFGFGILFPISAHALVQAFLCRAFIGLPCPKKMAGIGFPKLISSLNAPDHYLPLLYVIAQMREGEPITFPVEGFHGGSVSMLSVKIG
jgi:hypothetical protein